MAPVPTHSPVTGKPVPSSYVHSSDLFFRDTNGRSLLLRGINFCASAKTPIGIKSHSLDGFWEGGESGKMSFVGRVLDLEDGSAEVHLARLREWGFNCLRYVTTWESLEHEGPGKYDYEYMDYTIRVLRKCAEFGFKVYMDPHQDLHSRFSGGSGAPYWTIIACGLNPRNFTVTGTAYIECEWPSPSAPDPSSFPPMIWASNYTRLAVATINTLFWAGRDFAPKCIIDGVNVSDYLQTKFIDAYRALATRIRENAPELLDETILGWDSVNEPNHGLLGLEDVTKIPESVMLKVGPTPTMWQGMLLGMGDKVTVENWKFGPLGPKRDGSKEIDPLGKRMWISSEEAGEDSEGRSAKWGWKRDPRWTLGTCVWGLHGVWDVETKQVVKKEYFYESRREGGRKVEYGAEYWREHWRKWAKMVRECHEEAIHWIHTPVFEIPPQLTGVVDEEIKDRAVFSTHFYDGLTLITKHWNWFNADALGILRKKCSIITGIRIGETAIRNCLRSQLGMLKEDCADALGRYPTMMGEIGIPYDLDHKEAYRTGDYSNQIKAMDASMNACDGENCLNYSIWNYDPEHTHAHSDNWNGEDLSVWSEDDVKKKTPGMSRSNSTLGLSVGGPKMGQDESTIDLNDGARALPAFVRPFPRATVGQPTFINFDIRTATFSLKIAVRSDDVAAAAVSQTDVVAAAEKRPAPTEIYVPFAHFAAKPSGIIQKAVDDSRDDLDLPEPKRIVLDSMTNSINSEPGSTSMSASSTTLPGSGGESLDSSTTKLAPLRFNSSMTLAGSAGQRQVLDVHVEVSSGTWEVDGQTLRWWYDKSRYQSAATYTDEDDERPDSPTMAYGGNSAAEQEEWIKITRGSGPTAAWQDQLGPDGVVATMRSADNSLFPHPPSSEVDAPHTTPESLLVLHGYAQED